MVRRSAQRILRGVVGFPVGPLLVPMDSRWRLGYPRVFFCNSIIFVKVGAPNIFSRTLKGIRAGMSSRKTSIMVAMAPNWWEYVVRRISSRLVTCHYTAS